MKGIVGAGFVAKINTHSNVGMRQARLLLQSSVLLRRGCAHTSKRNFQTRISTSNEFVVEYCMIFL